MRLATIALAFVPFLLASGEKLDIPEVDRVVQKVVTTYYNYTHYQAPPGATNSTNPKSNSTHSPEASGQPYWYEQINHQGVSAFGPSGYAVYRNVKDYGAKGIPK